MPHVDLGAVANMLHKGMWALTDPNPAIVAVHNTTCVKSGLVRDDMTAISLEFMSLKLGQILH
jgi:hypothetical protein